jgi:putative endonuclease
MDKRFAVYFLANHRQGTLYVGVTSDLVGRIWQHKTKAVPGFTSRYGCDRLVCFEMIDSAETAMARERQLKGWRRDWKINLVEANNPNWEDLYPSVATR